MKRVAVFFSAFFLTLNLLAQKSEVVYNNPKDTNTNYFIAYKPSIEPTGLLLLLTSFGETPKNAANETTIQTVAAKNGLITVFASLQYGTQTFFIDSLSQFNLDALIPTIQKKYNLTDKPLYLGGFSLGGSGIIKYAERAYSSKTLVKPKAIFAIDAPIDFEKMYYSLEYAAKYSTVNIAKMEADYFIKRLQYEFQSTPYIDKTPFHIISPYSFSDTIQTNIQPLKDCPILLISEPDIIWQMEERNRSMYDLNTLDASMVINALRLMGNKKAKLVLTNNKGYRKLTGRKNPHSWSIADAEETVSWLINFK
ncbi:MAG: hypothetical protein ACOVSR_07960 [Bacteroidia bacterium]